MSYRESMGVVNASGELDLPIIECQWTRLPETAPCRHEVFRSRRQSL